MTSYRGIHNWVVYHYGKADRCEKCKCLPDNSKKRQYAWSNKSRKYKKDRKDWWRLCYSCHKKYDYKKGNFAPWNKGHVGRQKWHNTSGLLKTPWNKGIKSKKEIFCGHCRKKFYPPKKTSCFCSKSCAMYERK